MKSSATANWVCFFLAKFDFYFWFFVNIYFPKNWLKKKLIINVKVEYQILFKSVKPFLRYVHLTRKVDVMCER